MSLVEIADGAGETVHLTETDGCRTCTFGREPSEQGRLIRNIRNLECKPDDIFILAPTKSGTHWTWEIISMMLNGRAETIPKPKIDNMLEHQPQEIIDAIPSPRVLNSHLRIDWLPTQMFEKQCRLVYILRNPKDMAVSLYNHVKGIKSYHYQGQWKDFFPFILRGEMEYGSWFTYVREWERFIHGNPKYPIHLMFYEQLIKDYESELRRLAAFLGLDLDSGLLAEIADKCRFKNMQRDKALPAELHSVFLKLNFSFFRKGEIGDWKNWFTVAQSEEFDRVYEENMTGSSLTFQYN